MSIQVEVPQRKPYQTPVLQVYGGIQTLTQNAAMTGDWDNSGMATGNAKTG